MSKLGTPKKPAIARVSDEKRAQEIYDLGNENGLKELLLPTMVK